MPSDITYLMATIHSKESRVAQMSPMSTIHQVCPRSLKTRSPKVRTSRASPTARMAFLRVEPLTSSSVGVCEAAITIVSFETEPSLPVFMDVGQMNLHGFECVQKGEIYGMMAEVTWVTSKDRNSTTGIVL